jgi:hypothetical protein
MAHFSVTGDLPFWTTLPMLESKYSPGIEVSLEGIKAEGA